MARSFHDLPAELVQRILNDLELDDMRALRLTSISIADKINNSSFREYFRKKHVYVTSAKDLEDLVDITRWSSLACLLEDLVLVGIATFRKAHSPRVYLDNDSISDVIPCQLHGKLLGEALNNIRVTSQSKRLRSLSLEVVTRIGDRLVPTDESLRGSLTAPCKPRPSRPVWHTAEQTFEIAVIGLAKSQVALGELRLFTTVDRCALGADGLGVALDYDLAPSLRDVKKLSMRISAPLPPQPGQPSHSESQSVDLEESASLGKRKGKSPAHRTPTLFNLALPTSLAPKKEMEIDEDGWKIRAWLRTFPALKSLEIQWFDVSKRCDWPPPLSTEAFFDDVGYSMRWLQLSRVALRNINTNANALHSFLTYHAQLKEVGLHNVYLRPRESISRVTKLLQSADTPFNRNIIDLWGHSSARPLISHYLKGDKPFELFTISPKPREWVNSSERQDHERRLFGPPWRLD